MTDQAGPGEQAGPAPSEPRRADHPEAPPRADRSGARYTLVLGERDLAEGVVGVKDMVSGDQRAVPLDDVVVGDTVLYDPEGARRDG